jgi:hypothetical protein
MLQNNSQNSPKKFICESCDYTCGKKNDMTKHFSSQKHKRNIISNNCNEQFVKKEFYCDLCSKKYNSRVGLWRHKKTCVTTTPDSGVYIKQKDPMIELLINENKDFKNIILELVKNNGDLQKQMLDVCRSSNTMNNSHNHSHNKTFNLQFFLNEQCKDAMNIMDFVNSMTLDFSDLEDVGKLGYVEGISGIIIKKLNEMDIYKRPIHCSDGKREIMFVKDDNVWEKENSTYDRIRKAIKHITKKNGDMMIPWSKKYPACMNIEHNMNDIYLQIMSQSMGGKESFVESENKIMKKIARAVLIDKTC